MCRHSQHGAHIVSLAAQREKNALVDSKIYRVIVSRCGLISGELKAGLTTDVLSLVCAVFGFHGFCLFLSLTCSYETAKSETTYVLPKV